jgi:site-specific recombinase XerD
LGLQKRALCNSIPPGFATLLLEADTNLRYFQVLPGHYSSKMTEIDIYVRNKYLQQIKSPPGDLSV